MRPAELLVVYLLVGLAVAVAMVRAHHPGALQAVALWPLYLPGLLAAVAPPVAVPAERGDPRVDAAVDTLAEALRAWEGLPGEVDPDASLRAARKGLTALVRRVADLDHLLQAPGADLAQLRAELATTPDAAWPAVAARIVSLERLMGLRDQSVLDLERGLAGLADLTARVHVARFTGATGGDVAVQLAALAAAVDSAAEIRRLGVG